MRFKSHRSSRRLKKSIRNRRMPIILPWPTGGHVKQYFVLFVRAKLISYSVGGKRAEHVLISHQTVLASIIRRPPLNVFSSPCVDDRPTVV